jgi:hypothetical protein
MRYWYGLIYNGAENNEGLDDGTSLMILSLIFANLLKILGI